MNYLSDIPLSQISLEHIQLLVNEKWPEGKTLEYKRDTYDTTDKAKKELLKDVSAFANTQGGDILIGVDEDKGVPTVIPGVQIPDIDAEKLRITEIIQRGLEPRIDFDIHHISISSGTCILVIRVKESLLFPHRVIYGKFGEFYARNSAGKYSMDTDQLRTAFTLSESIYQQIRAFREQRVAQVIAGETPIPMIEGAKLVFHLIPVSSFRSRQMIDVVAMQDLDQQFPPLASTVCERRLVLDGHVSYALQGRSRQCRSYTQLFRNGTVESVLAGIVSSEPHDFTRLIARTYEAALAGGSNPFTTRVLAALRELGIQPPIWCFLTLTGVKGASTSIENWLPGEDKVIDREFLKLPEALVDDFEIDPAVLFRPIFDLVWNASGYDRSPNFDDRGKFIIGR